MKTMRKVMTVLAAVAVLAPAAARAETATCGMAMLRGVDVETTRVPQMTMTTIRSRQKGKPGDREYFAYSMPLERLKKTYVVTIQLHDIVYIAESSGDAFWDFNPGRLVVNDRIHACVTKDRVRMTRPDGKDYTAKIVRMERQP